MTNIFEEYTKDTIRIFAEASLVVATAIETSELIDFLFDLQNEVLKYNYLEGVDENYRCNVGFKFIVLRDFLRKIDAAEIVRLK